jgi:hypothetical protein
MRDWVLKAGDPLSLTLSADARLCAPDYVDDQIWEAELGMGEPAALAVRTTYGLRARSMRLFYRFGELGKTITNPSEFRAPLLVRRFYPNFLLLTFSPFEDLEITAEYWIPQSHALAGRLIVVNRTAFARKLNLELCGALTPLDGQSFAPAQQQLVNILSGSTSGLAPVLFMTGGPNPGSGPHPSLIIGLELDPNATRTIAWSLSAEASTEASFELARQVTARPWDAERAHIELLDAGDVLDIHTGDRDWDGVLALSQKTALSFFFPGNDAFPAPSFVQARQPDAGYSHRGDGRDYPPTWSGQAALETYYLASLLPGARRFTRGLIENFLGIQTEEGFVDGKPGLAGQRAKYLAAPLIASLAWNYYEDSQDETFIGQVFPKMLAFFWNWFTPAHDPDGDGIPQWDHVLQTGFEDHPLFDVWHPWSQGVSFSALHNPELEALLYREAHSLILMAEKLDRGDAVTMLRNQMVRLRAGVDAAWDPGSALYAYRDRISKQGQAGKVVAKHQGSGNMRPRVEFEQPVHLLVEVQTKNPTAKRPVVEIGELARAGLGETEVIEENQFKWRSGGLVATSQNVFSRVGRIRVKGLDDQDKIIIQTVDPKAKDITLFTPLWAGIPDLQRAQVMISRSLLDADQFDRPFGIPAIPHLRDPEADMTAMSVHFPWNQLIGEGLLAYGYRNEAARLTVHLMNAVIQNLRQSRAFYAQYHAETGSGIGERGALSGLAPVGLFLQSLGVTILSPTRVRLEGQNPFAWPVTLLYKGLKVIRGHKETEVIFPNGKSVHVTDPARTVVTQN